MRALGLDPSLRSYGWCIFDDALTGRNRRVISGHEATLSNTVPVARLLHFRAFVNDLLRRFKVDVVGMESPAYEAGPFQSIHFGLMMYSQEAIFAARKDLVLFDPTTLKYLTGRSNASKQDMQRFVQLDTMNPDIINNDEADAYCCGLFATKFIKCMNGSIPIDSMSKQEKRVFVTRSKIKKKFVKRTSYIFRENSRFFQFSKIPDGDVKLPDKSAINPELLAWLSDE